MSNLGVCDNNEVLLSLARSHRVTTAASLTRIFQHIKDGQPFAAMSAFVPHTTFDSDDSDDSKEPKLKMDRNKNIKRQQQLEREIQSLGYGFITVTGSYPYLEEKDEEGNVIISHEKTSFIIGIPFGEALNLGRRYDQESIIWGEEGIEIGLFSTKNGSKLMHYDTVTTQNIENVYSSYRNRKFRFANKNAFAVLEWSPGGYISGLTWLHNLKQGLIQKLGSEQAVDTAITELALVRKVAQRSGR